ALRRRAQGRDPRRRAQRAHDHAHALRGELRERRAARDALPGAHRRGRAGARRTDRRRAMTPRLVLEVLDGRATVRARARIDAVPATIGRGYDNDVILDDPYACATHVRITEGADGTLVAEDVGSVNGLRAGRNGARVPHVPLRHGTELRIGRTIVRCCDPAHPVPPALADDQEHGAAGRILASARWRVAAICASALALVAFEYAASIDRAGGVKALSETVPLLLILVLWSGGWALASRVVSHRFAFTRHFAYATLMAVAFTAF